MSGPSMDGEPLCNHGVGSWHKRRSERGCPPPPETEHPQLPVHRWADIALRYTKSGRDDCRLWLKDGRTTVDLAMVETWLTQITDWLENDRQYREKVGEL
jgi:hypothetical protein